MRIVFVLSLLFCNNFISGQINLYSDLRVCMPFNGNALDLSGTGNNGTVNGATLVADRLGNPGSAYYFNGTSDFISIANFANVALTNELTIGIWAKNNLTTSNCLFMLSPDNPADRCVGCAQYSNGGSTMMIWDYGDISAGGRLLNVGVPIDVSNWHHYVYIISESSNSKQLYLDGVLITNSSYGLSCNNKNLPFYIGAGNDGGAGGSIRFHGKIDDVNIYNRALTSNEVSALFLSKNICFSVGNEQLSLLSKGIFFPTTSTGNFTLQRRTF